MQHLDKNWDNRQIPQNGPPFPYQGVHGVFSLTLVLCQGHGSLRVSEPILFATLKVFPQVNGLPVGFLLSIKKHIG